VSSDFAQVVSPDPPPRRRVASHVAAIPPSGIRKFFDLVLAMDDVISLGVGEPGFQTPWNIREQAIQDLEHGRTSYTSNHGLLELRQEIALWLNRRYGLVYDARDEMVITVGASEAIDLALRALLDPGDEVIVVQPCYVSYAPNVILAGGVPVIFSTYQKDAFRLDFDALRPLVTPRTKAIMVNFPSNPTGITFTRADLEKLAAFVREHDLVVLSDEIYAELTYVGQHVSLAALPGMKNHTITISGFSKAFAMTGWRIGYACGPEEIISGMVKIHQYTMLCAPTLSQYAAIEALKGSDAEVEEMRREYERRGRFIVGALNDIGLTTLQPEGAFYAFANTSSTGMTSERFCTELLKEQNVAVVPGNAFGECGEGMIRCSYASNFDAIEKALDRMAKFVRG
jgi:aminotransferase